MKLFQGGLVSKTHRLLYRSTLGSRVIKKKRQDTDSQSDGEELVGEHDGLRDGPGRDHRGQNPLGSGFGTQACWPYRGTSLTRNSPPLEPYCRTMPGVLGGWAFSYGRGAPVSGSRQVPPGKGLPIAMAIPKS